MSPIRVAIADDHPILRQGVQKLLLDSGSFEVVGGAATGEEALRLVDELCPDILILDAAMPDLSGVDVAKQLHERRAAVRVLVLSAYDDIEYIRHFLRVGVAGYLLKDEASGLIVQAVQAVAHGETGWFSRRISAQLNRLVQEGISSPLLTAREVEVLYQVTQGKTNAGIGRALGISEKTVEKHLDAIYRKLDVQSRTEAAVTAIRKTLI